MYYRPDDKKADAKPASVIEISPDFQVKPEGDALRMYSVEKLVNTEAYLSKLFYFFKRFAKAEGIQTISTSIGDLFTESNSYAVDKLHDEARLFQKLFVEKEGVEFTYGENLKVDRNAAKTLSRSLFLFMLHAAIRNDIGRFKFNANWLLAGTHQVNNESWDTVVAMTEFVMANRDKDVHVDGRTVIKTKVDFNGTNVKTSIVGRLSNTDKVLPLFAPNIHPTTFRQPELTKVLDGNEKQSKHGKLVIGNTTVSAPAEVAKLIKDGVKPTVKPVVVNPFATKAAAFGTFPNVVADKKPDVKGIAAKNPTAPVKLKAPVRVHVGKGC